MELHKRGKKDKFERALKGLCMPSGALRFLHNDTCFEYSENENGLKKLLRQIQITVSGGTCTNPFNNEYGIFYVVTIERNGQTIELPFYPSLIDSTAYKTTPSDIQGQFEQYKTLFPYATKYNKYHDLKKLENEKLEKRKRHVETLLYSILCTCSCEYYCPISFTNFCDEFGYNQDSISAKQTWEKCLEQSAKLQRIFSETEIEFLPY